MIGIVSRAPKTDKWLASLYNQPSFECLVHIFIPQNKELKLSTAIAFFWAQLTNSVLDCSPVTSIAEIEKNLGGTYADLKIGNCAINNLSSGKIGIFSVIKIFGVILLAIAVKLFASNVKGLFI